MPASTKLLCLLGGLLMAGGVLLAAWQRIAPSAESTAVPNDGGSTIPGIGALLPVAGVVVAVVCLAAVLVLSRGRDRHR